MHDDIIEAREEQILLALQRAGVNVDTIERRQIGNNNESLENSDTSTGNNDGEKIMIFW